MMSTVKDLADAEAARAEAEEPEPDEDEEPAAEEEEPEPEPEAPSESDVNMEKAIRDLERENTRHEKAVAKIMGLDFAAFASCPLCDGFGFAPAGTDKPPELRVRADTLACPECDGLGQLITGSRVHGQDVLPCPKCTGNGYIFREASVTQHPSAPPSDLDPHVADLRARGYVVIEPMAAPGAVS